MEEMQHFDFASIVKQLPLILYISSPHVLQEGPQDPLTSGDLCLPWTQSA